MAATKSHELIGKQVLISFKTTHLDRAGETFSQVAKLGEIVALEASDWVVVDTANGEHIRCPRSKLHKMPTEGISLDLSSAEQQAITFLGLSTRLDYVAAEELIRDFHSATHPVTLRWLGRASAIALCRTSANAVSFSPDNRKADGS